MNIQNDVSKGAKAQRYKARNTRYEIRNTGHGSQILIAIVIFLTCFAAFTTDAWARYSGGTGEPNDPYRITTAEDLNDIGNHQEDWDKYFVLINDVNLAEYTGTQFRIIGNDTTPFTGSFDGNGYKILNFTYISTAAREYTGLFGYVSGPGAEIKNLKLIDPNVISRATPWVGSLAACLIQGTITGCCVDGGKVSGGGLLGLNCGVVSNCHSNCAAEYGGLVLVNRGGTITNCWSGGSTSGGQFVGGLAGFNDNQGTITNCYSIATVSGGVVVGGFVGVNSSKITNCYAAGPTYGVSMVGGLVPYPGGEVVDSFWDKEATGQSTSGGGTGKTTAEMKTMSTFTDSGWDFVEIWGIGENQTYPYLRTGPAGDSNLDGKVDLADLAVLASHWLEGPP